MLITAAILAIFVYGMIAAMLGTILPDLSALATTAMIVAPNQNRIKAIAAAVLTPPRPPTTRLR